MGADLLKLCQDELHSKLKKNEWKSTSVFWIIVGLSILIAMLIPDYFRIPIYASQTSKDFYNLVENLDEDSKIKIVETFWSIIY